MFRIFAILLSIQLFSSTALTAQTRKHKFQLKAAPTSLNPSISFIKVVDNRLRTEDFGYIKDNSAREQKLVTDGFLQTSLDSFLNKYFISVAHTGTDTLLLVIRNLYIEDRPANTDLGTIYVHADFYRGQNDNYYQLYHIDSFYQIEGRTATGLLSRLDELLCAYTTKALQDSLYNTSSAGFSNNTAIAMITDAKKQYPLYNSQEYIRGVYKNWQEMLMQTPSVTNFKMVYYDALDNAAPGPYNIDDNGKRGERIKPENYYAVFDGRKWHKSAPDGFAAISYIRGDYYIDAKFGKTLSDKERMVIMLFGITGYYIYKVTRPDNDKHSNFIYGKFLMKIDYNSGKLIPVRMIP